MPDYPCPTCGSIGRIVVQKGTEFVDPLLGPVKAAERMDRDCPSCGGSGMVDYDELMERRRRLGSARSRKRRAARARRRP